MAIKSGIGWTRSTFNPWRGCFKISAACRFCYADAFSKRNPATLGRFGTLEQGGTRVLAAEDYWKGPAVWNGIARAVRNIFEIVEQSPCQASFLAEELVDPKIQAWIDPMLEEGMLEIDAAGYLHAVRYLPPRVFCASLADVFEDWQGPMLNTKGEELAVSMADARQRLFDLIDNTPELNWLLLTKRPENIRRLIGSEKYRRNLWLGATVESQEALFDRAHWIADTRHLGDIRFLSMEPLLGPVMLDGLLAINWNYSKWVPEESGLNLIQWVIVGCESGPNRRPTELEWVRSIRDQCVAARVPLFVKQLEINGVVETDMQKFPEDLRIQEVPS